MENLEPIEWVSARQRLNPSARPQPAIDKEVSAIVGKEIRVNDPRLIGLVVKWKQESNKPLDSSQPDRFLEDPNHVEELKKAFL